MARSLTATRFDAWIGAHRSLAVFMVAAILALPAISTSLAPREARAVSSAGALDSVLAWGANTSGQLGNGTSTNSSNPVAVSLPPGTSVTAIAGGGLHSLALTSTGQLLAWGSNSNGQLGNATTTSSTTPVPVSLPSGTTVTAVAGGGQFSLALTSTGQVLAWGGNINGQLGNGTTSDSHVPIQVALPAGTTVTAIAAGSRHGLALTSTGQVLSWGWNSAGQLGNGTTASSSTPVVVGLPAGATITAIAGGGSHSLALTAGGSLLAWGDNSSGQLGNGSNVNSSAPVPVSVRSGTTITAVAAGYGHSLALTSIGGVLSWGRNDMGQLGNGSTANTSAPAPIALPLATAIAAGSDGLHSLALTSTGQAMAWGWNGYGQVGDGTTTNRVTPVPVSNLQTVATIAAGSTHSLAIQLPKASGSRYGSAWGLNDTGQLGNGTTSSSSTPVQVGLPVGTMVIAMAGGGNHSLALTSAGQVLAWGANNRGQLGNGTTINSSNPVQVSLPSGVTVTAIAAGQGHSLALTSSGGVLAWGANTLGQLGNGTTIDRSSPVPVILPSGTTVIAIATGAVSDHSLALTSNGQILAWGSNQFGQLGNGTTTNSSAPVPVSLPSGTAIATIAAGSGHSLAMTSGGQALAWGQNGAGELGNGTTTDSSNPVAVSLPAGTNITAISGGGYHSLAVTATGQVLAWGDNTVGQLGIGTSVSSSSPVPVNLPAGTVVTAIAGGRNHSLALTSTGHVLAWGYNGNGQLGNGTIITSATPVGVSGSPIAIQIAAGGSHSLAIQLPAVAVFPAMSNGAYGGYTTAATIQNTGTAPAIVRIAYFNQNGASVGSGDVIGSLPVNASRTVRQDNGDSFPGSGGNAAQAGSAVVYSSQPIASFVNEYAPGNVGDATSYSGVQVPSGVGTTLYAPTIVNNAYGAYTTGIGLLNQGSGPTDVAITYRDGSGAVIRTQAVSALAAHAYQALYSGDATLSLPSGFIGTATITSSAGQPLGAIVNETGPGGQFSSYDAVPSGSPSLNVPAALNNAYGGYYTGMAIQNTSASPGTVTVTYYDALGTAAAPKTFTIAANGYLGIYQGSATDGPAPGANTAVIQSTTVPLAAIVNEVAPTGGATQQSTSFNTFSAGSGSLNLPLVENGGSDPWNTGEGIMNTGASSAAVQVSYYDTFLGTPIGTPQTLTLAPRAFWGLYQPTAGLPSGTRATAVVSTSTGGQVAVICNESSPTTFMSYDGQ